MSEHLATIDWQRQTESFAYSDYNRDHVWKVSGGSSIEASAAGEFLGTAGRIDPEEALVAAIASCHMLTFLAICARRRIVVDSYQDEARGFMENNARGALAITRVDLSPVITFAGGAPAQDQLAKIHHLSHEECFIANSVLTEIRLTRYS